MAADERLICMPADLDEWAFRGRAGRRSRPGLRGAVWWSGQGDLNRCGHKPVELDYQPGAYFGPGRLYLICSPHGALYDPATGACVSGRCGGRGRTPVAVQERADGIHVTRGK